MQPSISDQIEISNPRSVVTKHVTNKCGKFYLRCDMPLLERDTIKVGLCQCGGKTSWLVLCWHPFLLSLSIYAYIKDHL